MGRSGSGKSTIANLDGKPFSYDVARLGRRFYLVSSVSQIIVYLICVKTALWFLNKSIYLTILLRIIYLLMRHKISILAKKLSLQQKAAYALEFIEKIIPQGFDAVIGENGASLSVGQRQRLAIARALLRNSPVLILDEATSALDTESERAIQSALEELKKDRTVVVIAHRLSTIENADEILVIDHGEFRERGNHKTLLDKMVPINSCVVCSLVARLLIIENAS